jgi:glutamate--cysteine ligase
MASPTSDDDKLLATMDDLLEPLHSVCTPGKPFFIGAEAEKFGVFERSLEPVSYEGEQGVVRVMRMLVSGHGWQVSGGDAPLLALSREGASITLEPGAQLELSGAPHADVHAVATELRRHASELSAISDVLETERGERLAWLGVGFHPFATQAVLPWVPKPRYGVMREYLPTRGAHGLDMMRRTSTVQANLDYDSEEGAMRALRVLLRLAPFFTAMFANSPFFEGKPWGGKSYRAKAWLDVDPSRQGLVPAVLREGATFRDYVEWALDAPMFLLLREGRVVPNTGQTFRTFFEQGRGEHRANRGDWVTHINSMFPEVRLKRTLEVRGCDSLPTELAIAPSALSVGLVYDARALDEADALSESFTHDELCAVRPLVAERALLAPFRGGTVGDIAERIVAIARGGLERRAVRDVTGRDESVYLDPLSSMVAARRSPADDLLDALARCSAEDDPVRAAVLSTSRV